MKTIIFYKQYFPENLNVFKIVEVIETKLNNDVKFILFGFNETINKCKNIEFIKKGCSDEDYHKAHSGNPILFFYEKIEDEFEFKVSGIAMQGVSLHCLIFAPYKGFFIELSEMLENQQTLYLYDFNLSFEKVIDLLCDYLDLI